MPEHLAAIPPAPAIPHAAPAQQPAEDLPSRTVRIGWIEERSAERLHAEILRESFLHQSHFLPVATFAPNIGNSNQGQQRTEQNAPVEQQRRSGPHKRPLLPMDRPVKRY